MLGQKRIGYLSLATVLGASSAAVAEVDHANVAVTTLRDGNDAGTYNVDDGRDQPTQQVGTGQEQVQMAQLASGELLMFGIGSYAINGQLPPNRLQGLCTSVTIDPVAGPQLKDMKYVSANDGDRYRNFMHPRVTPIFGGEAVAVTYNYAPDNLAYAYTQVFGPGCTALSQPAKIMDKNNDNCSETDSRPGVVVGQTATVARILEPHGCNGNGTDASWVAGVSITKNLDGTFVVAKEYDLVVEDEEERSRPTILLTGEQDFAVVCLTAGNTQPPNIGVRCVGLNTGAATPSGGDDERALWRETVAARDGELYRTMIRVDSILDQAGNPTPKMYTSYQQASDRRRGGKGSQTLMATVLQASSSGLTALAVPRSGIFPTSDATHGTMCSTMWGTLGSEASRVVLLSTSVNGSATGSSMIGIVGWDDLNRELIYERRVNLGVSIDNGWLSNIYGENPNNQGRNFIQCMGDVFNPGYGVEGGFMPEVASFVAIPATTRRIDSATGLREQKLATELVLVPAVIAPEPADTPETDPDEEPGGGSTPEDQSKSRFGSAGGLGCSSSGSATPLLALALIGFVVLMSRKRRRQIGGGR